MEPGTIHAHTRGETTSSQREYEVKTEPYTRTREETRILPTARLFPLCGAIHTHARGKTKTTAMSILKKQEPYTHTREGNPILTA